jgi:hypothetical protein
MGRRVLLWTTLLSLLVSYAGTYSFARSRGLIRAEIRATCSWRHELLPPTSPGQSWGSRATQPEENVFLLSHPFLLPWWPLTFLESQLFRAHVAAELEVLEPPGTRCSAVVRVPLELGRGELRVESGSRFLEIQTGGTSSVLFFEPGAEESLHWLGADRRTVTFTFRPEAGRHHDLTLPLE